MAEPPAPPLDLYKVLRVLLDHSQSAFQSASPDELELPISSLTPLDPDPERREVLHIMPSDQWALSTCASPEHRPSPLAARAAFLCRLAVVCAEWRREADALLSPKQRNATILAAFALRHERWADALACCSRANGAARQFAAFARVNSSLEAIANTLMHAEARDVAGKRYTEVLQFWCCLGRERVKRVLASAVELQFQMQADWSVEISRMQRTLQDMER